MLTKNQLPLANVFFKSVFCFSNVWILTCASYIFFNKYLRLSIDGRLLCHSDWKNPSGMVISCRVASSASQALTVSSAAAISLSFTAISCVARKMGSAVESATWLSRGADGGPPFTSLRKTYLNTGFPGRMVDGRPHDALRKVFRAIEMNTTHRSQFRWRLTLNAPWNAERVRLL